jgi:hypothetical protein
MPVGNGGIIGVANDPTVTVASGVWGMSAVYLAVKAGTWPGLGKTVIQTFTASGTWTCPEGVTEVEYLVVAGGGGGGMSIAGGGGAGGFRTGTGLSVTAGTDYTITVGSGGQADQTQEMVVMGQHLQSAALLYLMPGVAVAAHSEQVLTQVLAALVAAVLEEMAVVERLELLTQVAVVVGKAIWWNQSKHRRHRRLRHRYS